MLLKRDGIQYEPDAQARKRVDYLRNAEFLEASVLSDRGKHEIARVHAQTNLNFNLGRFDLGFRSDSCLDFIRDQRSKINCAVVS